MIKISNLNQTAGKISLIHTGDGSHSLELSELNETYHSRNGAIRESIHVFIKSGLLFLPREEGPVRILEVGFGTGLNVLLSVIEADNWNNEVEYTSLEPHPLPNEITSQLNYGKLTKRQDLLDRIHHSEWGVYERISRNFLLQKKMEKLEDQVFYPNKYHVVYFDAFAPSRQKEIWDTENLIRIYDSMRPGAVFVTYSAQGEFRRNLKNVGFSVERLPGPEGKKHMTRALKPLLH